MRRRQLFKKLLFHTITSRQRAQVTCASTQTTKRTQVSTCHPQRWKFVSLAAVSRPHPKLAREAALKKMQDHRTLRLCAQDRTGSIQLIQRKGSLLWVQVVVLYLQLQGLLTRGRRAERNQSHRNALQAINGLAGLVQSVVYRTMLRHNLLWSCQTKKTHLELHRQASLKKALLSRSTWLSSRSTDSLKSSITSIRCCKLVSIWAMTQLRQSSMLQIQIKETIVFSWSLHLPKIKHPMAP